MEQDKEKEKDSEEKEKVVEKEKEKESQKEEKVEKVGTCQLSRLIYGFKKLFCIMFWIFFLT